MNTKLSVVVITHNEAKNIQRCLRSLKGAKNAGVLILETIVVDSQSTDRTVALARTMGAKTFVHPWPGYSAQKNWAFGKCRGEWILSLDADEEITPELWGEIGQLEVSAEVDGFKIPRKAMFLGRWIRHGGWWPDAQLRLMRKGRGRFEGAIHEGIRVEGKVETLKNAMLHHTYETLSQYVQKMDLYSGVTAENAPTSKRNGWVGYLFTRPIWVFLKMFILKMGFLDGWHGFMLAILSAHHEFLKYAKIWERSLKGRKP